MRIAFLILMVISGFALGLQMVVNTRLRETVQSPVLSAVVSFVIGGTLLVILMSLGAFGGVGNAPQGFKLVPWWGFLGGIFGAVFVVASVVAVPKIGAAATVCATVLGQQVISLFFDTFGLMGIPKTPLTPGRLVGTGFLFVGVVLMQRK